MTEESNNGDVIPPARCSKCYLFPWQMIFFSIFYLLTFKFPSSKSSIHWNIPDKIPQRVSFSIPSHPSCLNHSDTVTGKCESHSSLSLVIFSPSLRHLPLSKYPSQDFVYEIPLPRFRKISC